jgi:uncharacterized pyridoxamine 5'-phosphate oxidase family protein
MNELLKKNFRQVKILVEQQFCTIDENYKLLYEGLNYDPEISINNENSRFDLLNIKYKINPNKTIELKITSLK